MKHLVTRFSILVFLLVPSLSSWAGEPWFSQNSGVSSNLKSVFFFNYFTGYAVGEDGLILKTTNGGVEWRQQTSGTTEPLNSIVFVSVGRGWVCGNNNVILKTTNGGTTWTNSNHGVPSNNTFNGIIFTDASYGYVAGQFSGDVTKAVVYSTIDGGASWTQMLFDDRIQSLNSVLFVNPVNGWMAASNGRMLYTTDGGSNWIFQSYAANRSVFFTDDSVGWASGDGNTVYWTSDGGTNWNPANTSQMNSLNDVHFINRTEGYAVGSPSNAVVKSFDGGRTWKNLPTQTAGSVFNSVYFVNSDTGWVVGSGGIILKTVTGGEVPTDVIENESMPVQTYLSQNYPNPFNPSTVISYQLKVKSVVSLNVFNVLGRKIATLVNEEKARGEYKVEWDATGFPSGLYLYKFQTGSIVEVRKMVLSK
ncbi:MAG: T9SS type A sorting domain-containing protein [Ignavibacteriae bacterium]|nr:T9SS type A sorting domain-containing protein [Ignavibacteriota bacterium]